MHQGATKKWGQLLVDFTQETTLHGIRYVTDQSKYLARRLTWILALSTATAVFIYFATTKLQLYYKYDKNVKVEVIYSPGELEFPSVTLCNLNQFHMRRLQKYGFIDTVEVLNSDSYTQDGETVMSAFQGEHYYFSNKTCKVPGETKWKAKFKGTRKMCGYLCSTLYNTKCASFLYYQDTCLLSSYTGNETQSCHHHESEEFYLRARSHDEAMQITCSFDSWLAHNIYCEFGTEADESKREEWSLVLAQTKHPHSDVTLESGYGHYILLPQTNRRLDFTVSYTSRFIQGDNMCLSLYYRFLGEDARLTVFLRTPDLEEHVFVSIRGREPFTMDGEPRSDFGGTNLFEELPDGEFQVKIQAGRSDTESSGVAIDNILIWPCKDIDHSCRHSKTGLDYTGTVSVTLSGYTCEYWNQSTRLHQLTQDSFPDRSMDLAENFCRNPYGSGMSEPFCYYYSDYGILSTEECNVPFCDCLESDMFQCDSGFCVPHDLLCNGVDDCGDSSDETSPCENKKFVTCDFEEEFMCGYYSDNRYPLKWTRHRYDKAAIFGSPGEDGDSSTIGHYLFVDSRLASDGDKAVVYSPRVLLHGYTTITMGVYINITGSGDKSDFSLYIASLDQRPLLKVFQTNVSLIEGASVWVDVIIPCLLMPADQKDYRLMFSGTLGSRFLTRLGIDNVQVETDLQTCQQPSKIYVPPQSEALNCSQSAGDCTLSLVTSNANLQWVSLPAIYVEEASQNFIPAGVNMQNVACTYFEPYTECMISAYNTEDLLKSPNFPSYYPPNLRLQYRIVTGTNSTFGPSANVTLQYLKLDIESDDFCDYDFLQISYLKGTDVEKKGKICGNEPRDSSREEADVVIIDFHSDDTEQYEGFAIQYTIEYIPNIEYTYALANQVIPYENDEADSVAHFAGMTTGKMLIKKDSCLWFDFHMRGSLSVHIISGDIDNIVWKINANEAGGGFIEKKVWQTANVNIPALSEPMVVSFDVSFDRKDSERGYVGFIKSFTFYEEQCPVRAESDCDFEFDLCGYTDKTPLQSDSGWRRVLHTNLEEMAGGTIHNPGENAGFVLGDFLLQAAMYQEPCILKSPKVNIEEIKCLSFHYLCGSYIFTLTILEIIEENGQKFNNTISFDPKCPTRTWNTKYINLPKGKFSVQFFLYSVVTDYFSMDNIMIMIGACTSPDAQTFDKNQTLDFAQQFNYISDTIPEPSIHYSKYDISIRQTMSGELIELGDLGVMTKSFGDTFINDLLEDVSHRLEDLILDCHWNNAPCDVSDFIPVHTEIGVCYSFNYDKHQKQKFTSQTGSGSGLELLINIEEYEHLPGKGTDAGIKIFLHTKDEIPYVKFLGAVVPPGMHSLVQIHPTKTIRLGDQYGNCSEEPSPLYPDESYSYYKCQRGCHTEKVVARCGCETPYMPGDSTVCSVAEYIMCGYPATLDDDTFTGCECLQACTSYQYDTQVSYSRLSRLNVDLLLDKKRDNITANYNIALENSRVLDKDALSKVLSQMEKLIASHKSYYSTVSHDVFTPLSSVVLLVQEAEKKMLSLAKQEMIDKIFKDFPIMLSDYETRTQSFWRAIQDSLQNMRETLRSYHSILQSVTLTTFNTSSAWASFIETKLQEEIPHVMNILEMYMAHKALLAPLKATYIFLPQVYIKKQKKLDKCIQLAGNNKDVLETILSRVVEYDVSGAMADPSTLSVTPDEIVGLMGSILSWEEQSMGMLEPCFTEFSTFLSETEAWLENIDVKTESMLVNLNLDGDRWLALLEINHNTLTEINTAFLARHITQVQLHKELVEQSVLQDTYSDISELNTKLETEVFKPGLSELATVAEELTSWYQEAINKSIHVGLYLSDNANHLESDVRNMHLWRKPYLNLDSSELIDYQYKADAIDKSWPKGKTLEEFFLSTSDFVVGTRVQAVFTSMMEQVRVVQNDLAEILLDYNTNIEELTDMLNTFVEDSKIDGEFVMDNFVQLNVFYGELKHNYVEEVPAYDIPTFFSELGGYLGLLLGASVITVCELIDMFLFNAFLKYKLKRLQKPSRVQVDLENSAKVKPGQ